MNKVVCFVVLALFLSGAAMAQSSKKELRHVVMFGWKAGADTSAIKSAVNAFRKLPHQINVIKKFEWGINNSPEKLNQGLTHCFLLTFATEKDRDEYLVHPAHKAFTQLLPNLLDKVTVFDYWAQPGL